MAPDGVVEDLCHVNIHAATINDVITGFFIVRTAEQRTRRDGGGFLVLELGNAEGRIRATVWDDVAAISEIAVPGQLVKIQGKVGEYEDRRQLTIQRMRTVGPEDRIAPADLVPSYEGDLTVLEAQLDTLIEKVSNTFLRTLLHNLLQEEPMRSQFLRSPAGKLWHHCYRGGLLEHSLAIAALCLASADRHPLASRDLLICGALLHDIGKVHELSLDGWIDYSDEGRLVGHIVMESVLLAQAMDAIEGFPADLRMQVLHLAVSHQGEKEKGSPVVPQTLEAIILHHADELDSKAAAFERIIRKESSHGKLWSSYINLIDRYLYLGNQNSADSSTNLELL
jgi:3'-5' exoribonuclease